MRKQRIAQWRWLPMVVGMPGQGTRVLASLAGLAVGRIVGRVMQSRRLGLLGSGEHCARPLAPTTLVCSRPLARTPTQMQRWLAGLVVVLGVSGVSVGHGGINFWTSLGLEGENIQALALAPLTPTTLYAGTSGAGVSKSVDGAGSWHAAGTGLPPSAGIVALWRSIP
jgi:hypothetical protein